MAKKTKVKSAKATSLKSDSSLAYSLRRYQAIVAFLVFMAIAIFTVIMMNKALNQPEDEAYRQQQLSQINSYSFDQATADKLSHLKKSSKSPDLSLPSGRINPFKD